MVFPVRHGVPLPAHRCLLAVAGTPWVFANDDCARSISNSGPGTVKIMITETDLDHLRRCVELARAAIDEGDEPFGSLLVSGGRVLVEDHNRVGSGDATRHPEFAIARWAAENLSPEERLEAIVYTSGEHCPMCAAAHAWVGLGRIVYASSSAQLGGWLAEMGIPAAPVRSLPIPEVAPDVPVSGPAAELADEIRELHQRFYLDPAGG